MKSVKLFLNRIAGAACLMITVFLTSCGQGDRTKQPLFSRDPKEIVRFNDSTSFPYKAEKERIEMISAGASKIHIGETGDSVFDKLGPPDEIGIMARPFDAATGWSWDYYVDKEYRHGPTVSDSVLSILFDSEGRVKFIKPADVFTP